MSVAWADWRHAYPSLFDSSAYGVYLANRLQLAFESGWVAAEKLVTRALEEHK